MYACSCMHVLRMCVCICMCVSMHLLTGHPGCTREVGSMLVRTCLHVYIVCIL